jgi:RNA polymerase-binding transcription factor DksA
MINNAEEKLKEFLEVKQAELLTRIQNIENEASRRNNPLSADFEEQAVERETDDVLGEQSRLVRAELNDIRIALDRLGAGTYGICGECTDPIPLARLKVMPMAMYCTDCQEYIDKIKNS